MSEIKTRRGRLSNEDIAFIDANLETMTDEEIAERIGKTTEMVARRRKQNPVYKEFDELGDFVDQLHAKWYWPTIKDSLLSREVAFFEHQWASYMQQFSSYEVVATDEDQIKDLVMAEIMRGRVLRQTRQNMEAIDDYQQKVAAERLKDHDERNDIFIQDWNSQITALTAACEALSGEVEKWSKEKNTIFKNMKTTRDQRIKELNDSRKDFWALVTTLGEKRRREKEAAYAELMRLAAEKSTKDLAEPTTYEDGSVDSPMLIPEIIEQEDLENHE